MPNNETWEEFKKKWGKGDFDWEDGSMRPSRDKLFSWFSEQLTLARSGEKAKTALEAYEIIHDYFMYCSHTHTLSTLEMIQKDILELGVSPTSITRNEEMQ